VADTEAVPVTVTDLDGEPVEVLMGADVAYITEYTGLTYRQLDYASRRGLLHPERQWKGRKWGSGSPRIWSTAELEVARTMGRLINAGLTLDAAHRIARSGESRAEIAPGVWIEVAS
jgi:DNA-binding transcriptional MerR regulator